YMLRAAGARGRIRSVIDWGDAVAGISAGDDEVTVFHRDGSRHVHARRENTWRIETPGGLVLLAGGAGRRSTAVVSSAPPAAPREHYHIPTIPLIDATPGALATSATRALRFELAARHYRRSEQDWRDAGEPRATVALAATAAELHIDVVVQKTRVAFAPRREHNDLDNEHPDINSDGVQLHLGEWTWLLVPEQPAPNVRQTARPGSAPAVSATWRLTSNGYAIHIQLARAALPGKGRAFDGDLAINEISPERERRRGQLMLQGADGEWVYLRGDRQDKTRFARFVIENA
ncbi:MAG: hypothetical protein AB1762_06470, partial [Gemmatimonadota bacterium]